MQMITLFMQQRDATSTADTGSPFPGAPAQTHLLQVGDLHPLPLELLLLRALLLEFGPAKAKTLQFRS